MNELQEKCERALQEGYQARKANMAKHSNPYSIISDWRLHDHWNMGWDNRNMIWQMRRKKEADDAYRTTAEQRAGNTTRREKKPATDSL